jgi:DNA polymerase III epsilon subunit-like protein
LPESTPRGAANCVRVEAAGTVLAEQTVEINLLPPSHWGGVNSAPELLAAFVRPTDPCIDVILREASDYGFISHEYERLERRFRFPKLCTVAGMRRRYPGHKSYGLGKLCEFYGIELKTHHRALCDARATSHLLTLINQKREAAAPSALEDAA